MPDTPFGPDEHADDVPRAIQPPPPVGSIAEAVVIKDGEVFFLCPPDGGISLGDGHGFGLYYHDCRFLNGYEMRLAGATPTPLGSSATGLEATLEQTNAESQQTDGQVIPRATLGVHWTRRVDGLALSLHDRITCENYGLDRLELPVSLAFQSEFEDVFEVRGLLSERPGSLQAPAWRSGVLTFTCLGGDGLWRALGVELHPEPAVRRPAGAEYVVSLGPRESMTIDAFLVISEEGTAADALRHAGRRSEPGRAALRNGPVAQPEATGQTQFRSDSPLFDDVMDRAMGDLRMLRSEMAGQAYFAAGLPWFCALFGRDSLITAIETLAFDARTAAGTLRLLAAQQGREVDAARQEEPGKILHEVRVGEYAHLDLVPQARYFGTVDATPLFLTLLGLHGSWTGDLSLFRELRNQVDLALVWMDTYADRSGHGWLEYEGRTRRGLTNEGWKDSGDAVMNDDGSLAAPPIALVEAQAYAWQAKSSMAGLFARTGERERARELLDAADDLRQRFERAFWLEDSGCYALALEQGQRPCRVISSNAGHVLWTGIAPAGHAAATARRLMAPDMFSGWGIRTLSSQERRYNPIGYHVGTVWPHDNAMIAAGFRRYGFDQAATTILESLIEAASHLPLHSLPELFAGFERSERGGPVSYPVACHPQAWSAASVPYLTQSLLGLQPEGFERRLRVTRPLLPALVHWVELRHLTVAGAEVDLRFERHGARSTASVKVLDVRGDLEVVVEDAT